jgi:hypothetical protein
MVDRNPRFLRSLRSPLVWLALLLASSRSAALGQAGDITGQIIDQKTQQPVIGAAIGVVGTNLRAASDVNGAFHLTGVTLGKQTLRVNHIAYGEKTIEVTVEPTKTTVLRVGLSETAISLEPITVNALTADERRERGAGYARNVVTRTQIAVAEHSNMDFADVLRQNAPSIRVRRLERVLGSPICIELRQVRTVATGGCLSPAVYLDGAPIVNPTSLYSTLSIDMIENIEVVPASEAGVRFGPIALNGALLIQTRRPGALTDEDRATRMAAGHTNFDWKQEDTGHPTVRVFAAAAAANAAGLAVGVFAAKQCLSYRKPSYDGIISDCAPIPTVAAALSAFVLPALSTGLTSRMAGRTSHSEGKLGPAIIGGAMTLLPGYGLMMTGQRNSDNTMTNLGYVVLAIGPPLMTTAADYLFRQIRHPKAPE